MSGSIPEANTIVFSCFFDGQTLLSAVNNITFKGFPGNHFLITWNLFCYLELIFEELKFLSDLIIRISKNFKWHPQESGSWGLRFISLDEIKESGRANFADPFQRPDMVARILWGH